MEGEKEARVRELSSVTSKKLPKNDFTRKIKDFDTFTKIA